MLSVVIAAAEQQSQSAADIGAQFALWLGVIAGIISLIRRIYRWAKRIDQSLEYVATEMRQNGGATMRDSLVRVESHVARIEQRLDDHINRDAAPPLPPPVGRTRP